MGIIGSLLVSAVVATTSASPLPWFNVDDYPTKAFAREWQGVTSFEVIVAPDGRPTECKVTKSSGYDMLDRQACYVAMHRPKFTPASAEGRSAYGVYRSQVVWARPDRTPNMQRDLGPDLEISVNQLPAGSGGLLGVRVAYLVDTQGSPSDCTAIGDSRGQPSVIVDVACKALLQQLPHQPVTADGATVAAVRTAAVKVTSTK